MRVASWFAGISSALCLCSSAWACPLECTKSANTAFIIQYPATVQYTVRVSCPWTTHGDTITTLGDSLMGPAFAPALPVYVAPASSQLFSYEFAFRSYEACKLAPGAVVGGDGSVTVPNVVSGYARDMESTFTCAASVVCQPPAAGGATRTPGWWKNRVDALAACVAGGVDLGYARITGVEHALGLLWVNEGAYSGLDKARLKLAKHTLVATCNAALLGAVPADFSLAQAVGLLAGNDCDAMVGLSALVDGFNNQFDEVVIPAGFDPGPAYGVDAKRMAVAPVFPAGSCQ